MQPLNPQNKKHRNGQRVNIPVYTKLAYGMRATSIRSGHWHRRRTMGKVIALRGLENKGNCDILRPITKDCESLGALTMISDKGGFILSKYGKARVENLRYAKANRDTP